MKYLILMAGDLYGRDQWGTPVPETESESGKRLVTVLEQLAQNNLSLIQILPIECRVPNPPGTVGISTETRYFAIARSDE